MKASNHNSNKPWISKGDVWNKIRHPLLDKAMESSQSWIPLVFIALLVIVIFSSPYQYADGNNGRYLPIMYRRIDPMLFLDDPIADAFMRFESVFYLGLGSLFHLLQISVLKLELVFYVLWIVSNIILLVLTFALIKSIQSNIMGFLLLGAWIVQQKAVPIGGDSLFVPTLTHATIAILLGIYSLIFLARGNQLIFWIILSGVIFVHSIIAIHLAILTFPVMIWHSKCKPTKEELFGWLTFGAAMLVYLGWMVPPSFNPEETRLFVLAKGTMPHISPLNQSLIGWINVFGGMALSWLAYKRYLIEHKLLSLLAGFMISGAFVATTLGFFAIDTGMLSLAQLQPMRMFNWVYFFMFILLSCASGAALQNNKRMGIVLLVVILLNVLDSLWYIAWLYFGIACFLIEWLQAHRRWVAAFSLDCIVPWGHAFLACAALAMWIFRDLHSFESFRDPTPVIVILTSLLLFWRPISRSISRWVILMGLLTLALFARSAYMYSYISVRQDQEYNNICRWIALNTDTKAHFITAVFGDNGGNFRARAIRTTSNEQQNALYWVAPLIAEKNGESYKQVMTAWNGQAWDVNMLLEQARTWNIDYLLIEGNYSPPLPVLHMEGRYRVIKVP